MERVLLLLALGVGNKLDEKLPDVIRGVGMGAGGGNSGRFQPLFQDLCSTGKNTVEYILCPSNLKAFKNIFRNAVIQVIVASKSINEITGPYLFRLMAHLLML